MQSLKLLLLLLGTQTFQDLWARLEESFCAYCEQEATHRQRDFFCALIFCFAAVALFSSRLARKKLAQTRVFYGRGTRDVDVPSDIIYIGQCLAG